MITQCPDCSKTGNKDNFCDNCTKLADYFDVYKYTENLNNTEFLGRIKAYRWKDALNFIKNSFFKNEPELVTNCEKDFAFVEKRYVEDNMLIGYKLYLNNISSQENISLWNLTS